MKRVAVIGAGISGLACALRLEERAKDRAELDVSVFDAAPRAGGSIRTENRDGFLLERGPDSFIFEKPWALDLCRTLGIEDRVLNTEGGNRKIFVVKKNRLVALPEGFYLIAPTRMTSFLASPLLSVAGKIRMASEVFVPRRLSEDDESVGSFIRRRFGAEALARVGQPMIAGIYSGDPERLSLSSTMSKFMELERRHGSVIRGLMKKTGGNAVPRNVSGPRYGFFLSFDGGMETLTRAAASRLTKNALRLGSRVRIARGEEGRWAVSDGSGPARSFDAVCLTVGAAQAARLVRDVDPALADRMGELRFESVATLNLAYRRRQISHPLDSFGFVVPAVEKKSLTACTFSSLKYRGRAPEGHVLLRAFIGGAFGNEFFAMDDGDLIRAVTGDLKELLGIAGEPLFASLARHAEALPQYAVGHKRWAADVEERLKRHRNLFLTGASYRGTGITHCIHDARLEADRMYEHLTNGATA